MIVFVLALPLAVIAALVAVIVFAIAAGGPVHHNKAWVRPFPWRTCMSAGAMAALVWVWCNGTGLPSLLYESVLGVRWPLGLPSALAAQNGPAEQARHADRTKPVIVLLGGGTDRTGPGGALRPYGDSIEKIALTAGLYHRAVAAGLSPTIIVSGGDPQRHGMAEADNYASDLRELGIPPQRLILENRSLNTYQNAANVAALLRGVPERPVILVTTALHMHRSLLDFGLFNLPAYPVALSLPPLRFSLLPDLEALRRANADLHELVGIAQFYVYRSVHLFEQPKHLKPAAPPAVRLK